MNKLWILLVSAMTLSGLLVFNYALAAASVTTSATASISSDSATGTSVAVPNIVITEGAAGDIAAAAHVWLAPTGYIYDTTSVPNVAYTGTGLAGPATVTFSDNTHMSLTTTAVSTAAGTLTIGSTTSIKIKASAGSPMAAAGNITMSTINITGFTTSTNFGTLTQVVGAANKLAFTTQPPTSLTPSQTFTVGVTIQDQYGNTRTADTNSVTVSSVSSSNTSQASNQNLNGTLTVAASAGVVTFNNLSYPGSDSIEIKATATGLTSAFSSAIGLGGSAGYLLLSALPPSSAITFPTSSSTLQPGSSINITGTTTQGSSSSIQGVQVSLDSGKTWQSASGLNGSFASWSYAWTVPSIPGTINIQSRAADWIGKVETPSAGVTITVGSATAPVNLNNSTPVPAPAQPTYPNAPSSTASPPSPATPFYADGTLIQVADSPTVYLVLGGVEKPFTSGLAFKARGYKFSDVLHVPANAISLVLGAPVLLPSGSVIKGTGPTIYVVFNGTKMGVPSMQVFTHLGLSLKNIITVGDSELAAYSDGGIKQ